jgi:hypothetical protein
MEMADYWLVEKQLVHKLFKVLVPRYSNYTTAYTRLLRAQTGLFNFLLGFWGLDVLLVV